MQRPPIGIIIANTGSPRAPKPHAVKKYLSRFLMDDRIAPSNKVGWWFILHCFILPKRKKASAERYQKIWTDEGSPLDAAHRKLALGIQRHFCEEGFAVEVRCAMSYGAPSMKTAIRSLQKAGCQGVIVLPTYPQSAYCITQSVLDSFKKAFRRANWNVPVVLIERYGDDDSYIKALAASIRHAGFDASDSSRDVLLFAFHSIPLKDIEKGDTYELQVDKSSVDIADSLGIDRKRWTIAYQCVFGKKPEEWLSPLSKDVLERWGKEGIGNVFMVCPGFAVDCLETLYDIPYELEPVYREAFTYNEARGDEPSFTYVPCLGSSKAHLKVLCDVLDPYVRGGFADENR